ncbi:unnamed protein product [Ectocarpus sp. 13 AM-2016]
MEGLYYLRRTLAFWIDYAITVVFAGMFLVFALYVNGLLAAHYGPNSFYHGLAMAIVSDPATALLAAFLFICSTRVAYHLLFLCSRKRATAGMMLFRLKIQIDDGVQAPLQILVLRRSFAALISYGLFFAGFLFALTNDKHQTIHDRLSRLMVTG